MADITNTANFDEWIEEFSLYMRQLRRSESTQRAYLWHLGKMRAYLSEHGVKTPTEVTRSALRHWAAYASQRWSPATYKQAVAAAKSFLAFLHDEGVTTSNLSKALAIPKVPDKEQRTLDENEVEALLNFASTLESPRREREMAMVSLLTDSGIRAAELCNARVDDIREKNRIIMIRGKGDSLAPAPYGQRTAEYLRDWLRKRAERLRARRHKDPGTIFISLGGFTPDSPLTTRGLREILQDLGKKAGVPRVSPHAFRRTFATLLHEHGAPSRTVQVAGRWRDIRMVERYTRALERKEKMPSLYTPYSPIDNMDKPRKE